MNRCVCVWYGMAWSGMIRLCSVSYLYHIVSYRVLYMYVYVLISLGMTFMYNSICMCFPANGSVPHLPFLPAGSCLRASFCRNPQISGPSAAHHGPSPDMGQNWRPSISTGGVLITSSTNRMVQWWILNKTF